jgi:hypothetical protein
MGCLAYCVTLSLALALCPSVSLALPLLFATCRATLLIGTLLLRLWSLHTHRVIYTIGEIYFRGTWRMATTQHVIMSSTFMLQSIVRLLHMNQTLPSTPPTTRCNAA